MKCPRCKNTLTLTKAKASNLAHKIYHCKQCKELFYWKPKEDYNLKKKAIELKQRMQKNQKIAYTNACRSFKTYEV